MNNQNKSTIRPITYSPGPAVWAGAFLSWEKFCPILLHISKQSIC